jgi:serralysin
MGLYDVSRECINSAEFKSIYGETLSPTDFVTLLYRNVLVREPDTGGLNYWIGRINTGMSKEEVLIHFSESAENKSKVTW